MDSSPLLLIASSDKVIHPVIQPPLATPPANFPPCKPLCKGWGAVPPASLPPCKPLCKGGKPRANCNILEDKPQLNERESEGKASI